MNAEASQGNSLRPCPFCGHLESATADRCRRCRLALDQKALHGLKRLLGVWQLLDERSPTSPGVNWQKFRQLIESDHVYEDSIIRGPATHGVWQYAKDTPSVATLLGLCWSCHCRLPDGRATHCPRCEVELNGPLDWPRVEEGKGGVEEPIPTLPAEEDLLAAGTGEREFRKVSGMTWKDLLLRLAGFLAIGAACAAVFWYCFLFAWHGRLVGPDQRVVASARPAAKPAAQEKRVSPATLAAQEQSEGDMDSAPPQVAALTPPPAPAAPIPAAAAKPATPVAPPAAKPVTPVASATPTSKNAPIPFAEPPQPVVAPAANEPQSAPAPVAAPAAPAAPDASATPARNSGPVIFVEPPRPVVIVPMPNRPQDTPPVAAAPATPGQPSGSRAPLVFADPPRPVLMPGPNEPPPTPTPAAAAAPASRPAEPEQPEPEGARETYSAKVVFAIAQRVRDEGDLAKALALVRQMMDAHDKKVWPDGAEEMLQATQKLIRTSPRTKDPTQAELAKMWQGAKELSDEAQALEKQNNLPEAFTKLATVIYRYPLTVWPKNTLDCLHRVIINMRKQDLPPLP